MGTMTLQNFKDDLKDASGRPNIDDARLLRIINNAQFEFGYAFKFPELQKQASIATVQGQYSYSPPADFRAMTDDGVRISSPQNRFGGILENESRTNFLRGDRFQSTATQGVIGKYHMFGKKIWVRPAPDSTTTTIDFDYWAKVPKLTLAADTSIFEDDWDEIIFRGGLYRIHLAYGEHDRMINVFNLFLGQIRSRVMAEDLEEFPEGGISAIQSQFDNLRR